MGANMDIITARIEDFCRLAGIGRSKVYEMIATGEIESVHLGGRRLIVVDSWRRLVAAAPRDLGPRPAIG
jgi:excisionase family DNA binding protein